MTTESSELFQLEEVHSLDPAMEQELSQESDSSNLTKRDLVMKISEETGLLQSDVFTTIQKTLDYITNTLANGRNVEFRNFGVFKVVLRRSKSGRNPKNPTVSVPIPARAVVKFVSGKIMRHRVLNLTEKLKNTPSVASDLQIKND